MWHIAWMPSGWKYSLKYTLCLFEQKKERKFSVNISTNISRVSETFRFNIKRMSNIDRLNEKFQWKWKGKLYDLTRLIKSSDFSLEEKFNIRRKFWNKDNSQAIRNYMVVVIYSLCYHLQTFQMCNVCFLIFFTYQQ